MHLTVTSSVEKTKTIISIAEIMCSWKLGCGKATRIMASTYFVILKVKTELKRT